MGVKMMREELDSYAVEIQSLRRTIELKESGIDMAEGMVNKYIAAYQLGTEEQQLLALHDLERLFGYHALTESERLACLGDHTPADRVDS